MAVAKRPSLPVWTGKICRSGPAATTGRTLFDGEMQPVEVGLAEASLGDLKEAGVLQLLEVGADTSLPCPHVVSELLLARKTGIVTPGIFEQHGVSELATDTDVLVGQHEVGYLRKPAAGGRVGGNDLDVASMLPEATGDVVHTKSLYPLAALTRRAGLGTTA